MLGKVKTVFTGLSESYSKVGLFTVLAQIITSKAFEHPDFYGDLAGILEDMITYEAVFYDIRAMLADFNSKEGSDLFRVLYPAM